MANKKKKNQDTSPLALGRQQKGSAANKKANKAGSSNGSQPSSSNYSSRTSSSSRSSSNQRSANTAANNDLKQNQIQRSQQQNRQLINRITESSNARRTAAQRQKITAGIDNSTNARKEREQRRLQAQAQKSGTNAINRPSEETRRASRRALKNTPKLVSKAVKDTISGHGQTIADVTELTAEKGTNAYAMKTGLSEKIAEADRKRAATEARKERKKMQAAQEARQAEWDELTKAAKGFEKAYYGAVESGTGMLTDLAIGGGTQLGALAAMGSRTYGQTRGQAEKEGATQSEDRRYALLQAAKEVGTELMFPGAGLAKKTYGKVGLPFAETLANAATKNLSGTAANVTRAGLKLAGGVAEENAEEFGGWLLDPLIKEYTYGKNVRERRRSELQRESDEWRSNILNDDDARSAAAYLNSSFIADNKKIYMDNGMSEGEAQKLAEAMRDYFTASLTGDTKKMEEIEDKLVGKGLSKKDWSLGELAETLAATTLLTGATGLPGTVMSSAQGAAFKGELGENGIKALAKTAKDFEDKEMSLKAEVMADRIESGKEITDTEAYELKQGLAKQLQKDSQRETASVNSAMVKIQSQDLVSPLQSNANGEVLRGEVTEKAFKEENTKAKGAIKDVLKDNKESLTTKEINTGSRAIADFKVGTFDVNDANALNYSNKAVRTAFEESTGIDLEQYVVKNKDGSVNIPATNAATKDALFAMAADNLVKSAQAETVYWMDTAKGEVVTQVSARMGASGSEALQQALDDVDERDRSAYMMTANATDMLYQAARNMGIEWKDVASEATKMFPGIPESKLKMMYDAGLDDRKMAMDKARGRSVEMGKKLSEMSEKETATGKVFIDTNKPPLGTVIRTFTEIAKNLGADIHLTDAIKNVDGDAIDGANGAYDPDTNTFYLNLNTGMEKNIGYIFMHEVTHYIKRNAPEEYLALENLVREKWFQFNPEQMQDAIARKIEAYKKATKGKQVLTEEQALEEIIADAAHEFINDPNFAKQIADEDTGLAKAVLNSIRNALRMLRRIFASGSIDEETHMNSLFSELGILDEAEKIWLNAYTQAVKMRADQAINDWQDAVNESDVRFSIPEYTQEEMDAHRQYLIDSSAESYENPYTNDLNESGFIFPDGSLPRMGEYGQRADDHNLVIGAYDDIGYDTSQHPKADAMARFLNEGNIRYMPENGSIELGTEAEPTYEQYERIREMDYVNMIEFTAPDGSTADYKEYDGDRSGVVNDIKRFYRDGEIGGSELGQFRYSISDAEREALNTDGVDVTESGSAVRYSFASWSDTDKEDLLEKLVSAGYDRAAAERWIDDVNSI